MIPSFGDFPKPPEDRNGWPWHHEYRIPDSERNYSHSPNVSVVTPSFNQGRYIEATIRSVLLQDYARLEYIIIDGGSNDSTLDVLRKYQTWIDFWVSEPDNGQTHAINKGFRMAHGDILAWLNSDDLFANNHVISEVVDFFVNHEDVSVVYGDCLIVDERGSSIRPWKASEFSIESLIYENYIPQMSTFIRKGALEAVNYLNEELQHSMDYDLWLRISHNFALKYHPSLWSHHRMHSQSKTMTQDITRCEENLSIISQFMQTHDLPKALGEKKESALAKAHFELILARSPESSIDGMENQFSKIRSLDPQIFERKENLKLIAIALGKRKLETRNPLSLTRTFYRLCRWFRLPFLEHIRCFAISHVIAADNPSNPIAIRIFYWGPRAIWCVWCFLKGRFKPNLRYPSLSPSSQD